MLEVIIAQFTTFLLWVNPGSDVSRLLLFVLLLILAYKKPVLTVSSFLWQSYFLLPDDFSPQWDHRPLLQLRCEYPYWFICKSQEGDWFSKALMQTKLNTIALSLRDFVEFKVLQWDMVWGPMVMSLLFGGEVDRDLKLLYRNLGFLHVLVVSGSQFTLLSKLVELVISKPLNLLYALTAIKWRVFRIFKYLFDFFLQIFLIIYLLASGSTAPCQRAFLVAFTEVLGRWYFRPLFRFKTSHIFGLQMLLFPNSWFTLSNCLSWGAVLCLSLYNRKKTLVNQLRTSSAIQVLNLAFFGRVSISALMLDFFLAPLWDFLLIAALLAIFAQDLNLGALLSEVLNQIHSLLAKIENWQTEYLGSTALSVKKF